MPSFMTPGSVLAIFIAGILGVFVVPQLGLISRSAATALKVAVTVLGVGVVFDFFAPMIFRELSHYQRDFDPMLVLSLSGPLFTATFWGCLAWALLAVLQSAPPKGLS